MSTELRYVTIVERANAHRWRLFPRRAKEPGLFPVLRLRYQGSADRWLIGICKDRTETFCESELPTRFGPTTGTPPSKV
ncbi:hypothetical protein [Streptomyces galilaeus]|uniref:hypothetical protein n=1 Tax=Streptomyces galilaeus TaxID=33899 RepID=UPI0038F706CA